MLKTSVKILLMFVLVVAVAAATGLATYNITRRMTAESPARASDVFMPELDVNARNSGKPEPISTMDNQDKNPEHYTIRLEGETLGVYVSYDGKEEFLYNEDIYKNNLSHQDIELLEEGVEFTRLSELTGFIENFTS